jgi:hypothetical protein
MTKKNPKPLVTPAVLAIILMITSAPSASAQDGWDFDLAIYGWLPTIEGKLAYEIPELGDSIEVDPETLLDNLQFTAMVAFAANHGKWSILGDVIYLKEAASEEALLDSDSGLTLAAELELKAWITSFGGAYELTRSDSSSLGLLFGARYFSADTGLALRASGPLEADAALDSSATVWNGFVGIRGWIGLSDHWFVPYHLDLGTGDSDFTWQGYAGIGHQWRWGSLVLGYRYLDFDQGDNSEVRGLTMAGAELGVSFRF